MGGAIVCIVCIVEDTTLSDRADVFGKHWLPRVCVGSYSFCVEIVTNCLCFLSFSIQVRAHTRAHHLTKISNFKSFCTAASSVHSINSQLLGWNVITRFKDLASNVSIGNATFTSSESNL